MEIMTQRYHLCTNKNNSYNQIRKKLRSSQLRNSSKLMLKLPKDSTYKFSVRNESHKIMLGKISKKERGGYWGTIV